MNSSHSETEGAAGFSAQSLERSDAEAPRRGRSREVEESEPWRPRLAHLATPEFLAVLCALGFVGPG